jgi:glycine hydroxymethyltransferase
MQHLKETDPAIYKAIADELKREQNNLELIASENIVSEDRKRVV